MPTDRVATAFAPAKINLALHVTGRRGDGYHLLDSIVVFSDTGDRLRATATALPGLALTTSGRFGADIPAGADNLVLRAAALLHGGAGRGARIELEKHLPPASGIGGGSADAAATLQLLAGLWQVPLPPAQAVAGLGADVPVCLAGRPARMRGIGEALTPLPALPPAWLLLVNPGVAVPTGAVFAALPDARNAPLPATLPEFADAAALAGFLRSQRNDLEAPARGLHPEIGAALTLLGRLPGCLLARMSGSGATCFGLFADAGSAAAAAATIGAERPGWWITPAAIRR